MPRVDAAMVRDRQRSRIAGLLEQPLLLLPEPGQGLARGDDVEVEIAQSSGELLGRGERRLFRRISLLAPRRKHFRDQTLSFGNGTEPGWRRAEKHLGAVGNPGR